MNRSIVSDAALRDALRAAPPIVAPVDLRDRILDAAAATRQHRPLPWPLALLGGTDPMARRRSLLLAAALLLLALVLAVAAAVGSRTDLRPDPFAVDPAADPAGYLHEAYLVVGRLPAFEMVAVNGDGRHRILSDGHGTIRDERPDAGVTLIASAERSVQLSLAEDGTRSMIELSRPQRVAGFEVPGLIVQGRCEEGVVYLGPEVLLDRPVHHLRCGARHYWVDAATGLPLRAGFSPESPLPSAGAGVPSGPSAAPLGIEWEVIELRLGAQPPDLFRFDAAPGVTVVRADDPACRTLPNASCEDPAPSDWSPPPFRTPPPAATQSSSPTDMPALLAAITARYTDAPALAMVVRSSAHAAGDANVTGVTHDSLTWADGTGRFRTELDDGFRTIYITTGGHIWIRYRFNGPETWADNRGPFADHGGGIDMLGWHADCAAGWQAVGVDLVLGRTTIHLACGNESFWIDEATHLVLRSETGPEDSLHFMTWINEVVELRFGPQPADLFQLPAGAMIDPRPPKAGAATPPVEVPSSSP